MMGTTLSRGELHDLAKKLMEHVYDGPVTRIVNYAERSITNVREKLKADIAAELENTRRRVVEKTASGMTIAVSGELERKMNEALEYIIKHKDQPSGSRPGPRDKGTPEDARSLVKNLVSLTNDMKQRLKTVETVAKLFEPAASTGPKPLEVRTRKTLPIGACEKEGCERARSVDSVLGIVHRGCCAEHTAEIVGELDARRGAPGRLATDEFGKPAIAQCVMRGCSAPAFVDLKTGLAFPACSRACGARWASLVGASAFARPTALVEEAAPTEFQHLAQCELLVKDMCVKLGHDYMHLQRCDTEAALKKVAEAAGKEGISLQQAANYQVFEHMNCRLFDLTRAVTALLNTARGKLAETDLELDNEREKNMKLERTLFEMSGQKEMTEEQRALYARAQVNHDQMIELHKQEALELGEKLRRAEARRNQALVGEASKKYDLEERTAERDELNRELATQVSENEQLREHLDLVWQRLEAVERVGTWGDLQAFLNDAKAGSLPPTEPIEATEQDNELEALRNDENVGENSPEGAAMATD